MDVTPTCRGGAKLETGWSPRSGRRWSCSARPLRHCSHGGSLTRGQIARGQIARRQIAMDDIVIVSADDHIGIDRVTIEINSAP